MFSKLHKLVVLSLLCPLQLLFSSDGNLLKNGDFSQGTANWNRVKVDWQTASGELIVRNPDEVRDPHSRLVQQKISLEKGKRYQLSFQQQKTFSRTMRFEGLLSFQRNNKPIIKNPANPDGSGFCW